MLALPSSASGSEDDDLGEDDDGEQEDVQSMSDDSGRGGDLEEDFDKDGWGSSRKDYYDADVIETEADALEEEEEALRLQKKQLQGMTAADFGFDESEWLDSGKAGQEGNSDADSVVEEILPQPDISEDMPLEERNRILSTKYPEFEPLAKEFLALQAELEQARLDAHAAQKLQEVQLAKVASSSSTMPSAVLRWTALSTYLSALSMYFAILTSGPLDSDGRHASKAPLEMRSHAIMDSLMRSRTMWHAVRELKLPDPVEDTVAEASGIPPVANEPKDNQEPSPSATQNGDSKVRKERKSKAQIEAEKVLQEEVARRAERQQQSEADFARLARKAAQIPASSALSPATKENLRKDSDSEFDFGDVHPNEGETSTRRQKSLQFYTSQIAQKANKRAAAARYAGGDDDIPYRERFRDRQARLNAEAEARGRKKADVLGESSGDENDARVAAELRSGADGGEQEDYYASVASATTAKKADKAARREAQRQAASVRGAEVREVEEIGPDGKRAITYAIEKNKGLTPKRKKEVRNPRVKKRKRFEDKMKKLKSIRKVYKGGEEKGGYGGERTGIKSSLVRSVKL